MDASIKLNKLQSLAVTIKQMQYMFARKVES